MFAPSIPVINGFLRNSRSGWIGMDISRNAIHLAQLDRSGTKVKLDVAWTAFQDVNEADPHQSLETMIEQAKKARCLFNQASAAMTIGDGLIDYREFELDVGDPSEIDSAVRSELENDPGFDLGSSMVQAWELPTNRRSQSRKQNAAVVSTEYAFSRMLGDKMSRAGYSPEVLDAIPCALARSADIFLAGADQYCLVAHLGDTFTTLSLVHQGFPVLTRILSQHGFQTIIDSLAKEFSIGNPEVNSLLLKLTQNESKSHAGSSDLFAIVSEYQLRFVKSMASEVYRTLEYIRSEQSGCEPTGLILCGNGSIMPSMPMQFEQLLEIPTETWSISLGEDAYHGLPISLYAVAAGLSAIAWEKK